MLASALLISEAYAQDAAAAATPSPVAGMLPLILIMVVFYFLLIRPQQKKMREHQAMISAVKVNDKVVTAGGVHGKVTKVEDDVVSVSIADGVEVKVEKATLSQVAQKKPVNDNDAKTKKQSKKA